jgi:erythromycin esterase
MALTRRTFLLGAAGAAGVAGTAWWAHGRWELGQAQQPVLAWMRDHAQPFNAAEPDSLTAGGKLLASLAGARIIGIGEATHGSVEDVACKAATVRALVQAGAIDTLLLEANGPGGRDLDAFIGGEAGDPVERVRAAPIFRILKTQAMAELIGWLRDWNRQAAHRVHIVGVDCQATAADAAVGCRALGHRPHRDHRLGLPRRAPGRAVQRPGPWRRLGGFRRPARHARAYGLGRARVSDAHGRLGRGAVGGS